MKTIDQAIKNLTEKRKVEIIKEYFIIRKLRLAGAILETDEIRNGGAVDFHDRLYTAIEKELKEINDWDNEYTTLYKKAKEIGLDEEDRKKIYNKLQKPN